MKKSQAWLLGLAGVALLGGGTYIAMSGGGLCPVGAKCLGKSAEGGILTEKAPQTPAASGWLTDWAQAQASARERNVPILLNFSGSDWCGWCIRLDKEVWQQPEFKEWATENLQLLEVDFPRKKQLDTATEAQNQRLAQQYEVEAFPTVILVDADGKELARTGYQKGGAADYVKHLQKILGR